MANTPISGLPTATTVNAGDAIPFVQSGTTKKFDAALLATQAELDAGSIADRSRANHTGTQAASTITGLATVATSGSYADLSNKPTIPTVTGTNTGDQTITLSGSTLTLSANGGTVTLPAGSGAGISQTDVGNYWTVRKRPYQMTGLTAGADNTTTINNAIANASAYDTIVIPPGTWTHSATIQHAKANVTVEGYGARLQGTVARYGGYHITGSGAQIRGIIHEVLGATARGNGENFDDCPWSVDGASDVLLEDVESAGSRDAQFFISGVNRVRLNNIIGRDSFADGLHISGASQNVVAEGVNIFNSGDDGVAVVSYTNDSAAVQNVRVSRARVTNAAARGFSVAGGNYVTYTDAHVYRSRGSALYVAHEQGSFNTRPCTNVRMVGGTVEDANYDTSLDTGAIGLFNLVSGTIMQNVLLAGFVITDMDKGGYGVPYGKIGTSNGSGGRLNNVTLQDIQLAGGVTQGAPYRSLNIDGVTNSILAPGSGLNYSYVGGSGTGVTATARGFTVSGTTNITDPTTTTTAPGLTVNRVRTGPSWAAN